MLLSLLLIVAPLLVFPYRRWIGQAMSPQPGAFLGIRLLLTVLMAVPSLALLYLDTHNILKLPPRAWNSVLPMAFGISLVPTWLGLWRSSKFVPPEFEAQLFPESTTR